MKKRIFSLVIAVILCFAMTVPVTILADNFDDSKVYWKKTVTVEGRKVKLVIESVNGAGKLAGGNVTMTYDSDALTFNSEGSSTKIDKNFGSLGNVNPNKPGRYIVNFAGMDPIENDGVIAVAMFDIAEGKVCNADTFKLEKEEFSSSDPKNVKIDSSTAPIEFTCLHKNTVEGVKTPAACEDDGVKTITCSDCGNVSEETIGKLGHDWDDGKVTTEPTAESKGVKTFTCKRCETTKTEEIDALKPFDPTKVYWKKTVTVEGRKVKLVIESVNGAGKLAGGNVTMTYDSDALTFNSEGSSTKIDKNFGSLGNINPNKPGRYIVNFAGMDPIENDGVIAVAMFDIAEGKFCTADTFKLEKEEFSSEDPMTKEIDWTTGPIEFTCKHTNTHDEVVVPATCKADGSKAIICDSCGETIDTTTIPKGEHNFTVKVEEKPATCTEGGQIVWKCSACDETKTESTKPLGHNEGEGEVTTKPTCENEGVRTFYCTRCKEEVRTEKIDALGHNWGEWKETTAPTCTEKGVETRTCKNDATHTETRDVAALGHSFTNYISDGNATCTEDGTKTAKCDRCDVTDTVADTGSALGHDYKLSSTVSATCEEDGKKVYVCTHDSSHTYEEIIEKLGHDLSDAKVTKEPKCEEKGEKVGTCSRCHEEGVSEEIPALGHDWDEGKVIKEATAAAEGTKIFTCKRENCDETKEGTIAKLPPVIIEGNNSVANKEQTKDMTFRSDAAFVDFIRVELDGKVLDAKNYTIKEGSIIVTLNKDFVSTLSVGEHTLGIVSTSGTALAKFTIEANENSAAAVSPKTGDSSQVVLYSFAAIISLAAIAVIVYKKKISE